MKRTLLISGMVAGLLALLLLLYCEKQKIKLADGLRKEHLNKSVSDAIDRFVDESARMKSGRSPEQVEQLKKMYGSVPEVTLSHPENLSVQSKDTFAVITGTVSQTTLLSVDHSSGTFLITVPSYSAQSKGQIVSSLKFGDGRNTMRALGGDKKGFEITGKSGEKIVTGDRVRVWGFLSGDTYPYSLLVDSIAKM